MSGPQTAMIVFAAAAILACGNEPLNPVSGSDLIPQDLRGGTELPFRGSFRGVSSSSPIVPPSHTVTGALEGTATHLGRFTLTSVDVVSLATRLSTGTWNFTAANGDQLFTTTAGAEDEFTPPNVSHVTLVATIVGGTGRFAEAAGSFTLEETNTIDFATGTASVSGSFDGEINLSK